VKWALEGYVIPDTNLKEKEQKYKYWSTKHYTENKTPLKPGGGEMYLHQVRKYKNQVNFCKNEKFVCCMYFFVEIDDCHVDNNDRKYY
jgi:hypothetical protein